MAGTAFQFLAFPQLHGQADAFLQIFAPKDKLAEWFEFYANALELNVWCKTAIKDSEWSDTSREWTVTLEREKDGNKETRKLSTICFLCVRMREGLMLT